MNLTTAAIIAISQAGGSVDISADGSVSIRPAGDLAAPLSPAKRQRRMRARRRSAGGTVAANVTPIGG
ncbi:MAG: hypothetical protein JWM59_2941 [Verrucomicrobiales bacterium]|nr:hypothetical protein [Verrucomicrobiales bacterium]